MENLKILRRLEGRDVGKNRSIFAPNVLISFRFRSSVDLSARLEDVRAGIRAWKSMHPLLRAKVIKMGETDEDFYYVIDENSSANRNLKNFQFLRVNYLDKGTDGDRLVPSEELLYELMFENYMSEKIDCEREHDLLWKLCFIELRKNENEIVYELFWYFHHMIGDGISAKENGLLLLELIEKSLKGEACEPIDYGMYPGSEKLFEREIASTATNPVRDLSQRPEFVKSDEAIRHAAESLNKYFRSPDEIRDFELVDLNHDGRKYASFGELVELSRTKSNHKPKRCVIDQPEFLRLQKK